MFPTSPLLLAASVLLLASSRTTTTTTHAFVVVQPTALSSSSSSSSSSCCCKSSSTTLSMGLFDGVKDAFSAPALERSAVDSERETPIDRWFGWSVVSETEQQQQQQQQQVGNFVDSMDDSNYVAAFLTKPMGIVFEENDQDYGGIFVQSLKQGGMAEENGVVQAGDQLVMVQEDSVAGLTFDEALGKIVECDTRAVKLVLFRGSAEQLYGPTGASQEWLQDFCAKGGVQA